MPLFMLANKSTLNYLLLRSCKALSKELDTASRFIETVI